MYILKCSDGSFYTGSTWNLEKRLWDHMSGQGSAYTSHRLPVELIYCEEYDRILDAYTREKEIQGWSRRKKIALIRGNTTDLKAFSKNYTQNQDGNSLASTGSASE
jgi:putative endonuclease